jgi:choline-phosphate cytidylyltransferase
MGYVIVPAPWWKTDYFEIRYENSQNNKRVFYQLEGEGIRYEILAFMKGIELGNSNQYISSSVTRKICNEFKDYYQQKYLINI